MGSESVVDVRINGSVEPDGVRVGEEFRFAVRANKAAKDFVAGLNPDRAASIIDGRGYGTFTVGAEGPVEPDAFHCIVQEPVVCLGAVNFGPLVDVEKVGFSLV